MTIYGEKVNNPRGVNIEKVATPLALTMTYEIVIVSFLAYTEIIVSLGVTSFHPGGNHGELNLNVTKN